MYFLDIILGLRAQNRLKAGVLNEYCFRLTVGMEMLQLEERIPTFGDKDVIALVWGICKIQVCY